MKRWIKRTYGVLLALLAALAMTVPALADTIGIVGIVGLFIMRGIWWILIAAAVVIPMAFIIRGILRECRGLRKSKEDKEHEKDDP